MLRHNVCLGLISSLLSQCTYAMVYVHLFWSPLSRVEMVQPPMKSSRQKTNGSFPCKTPGFDATKHGWKCLQGTLKISNGGNPVGRLAAVLACYNAITFPFHLPLRKVANEQII